MSDERPPWEVDDVGEEKPPWEVDDTAPAAPAKPKWASGLGGSGKKPAQPKLSWWEKIQQLSSGVASQYPDVVKGAAKEAPLVAARAAQLPQDVVSGAIDKVVDWTGNPELINARLKQAEQVYRGRLMYEKPLEEGEGASTGEKVGRGVARAAPQIGLGVMTAGASLPAQAAISGAAQGAQALSEGAGVGEAALSGGIAAAAPGVGKLAPAAGKKLMDSATAQYLKALYPTTRATKAEAAKIVPELLERGVHGSMAELREMGAAKSGEAGAQLGKAYRDASQAGETIDAVQIADELEGLKDKFLARATSGQMVPTNPGALKAIEGLQETLQQLGDKVSPDQLWKFRQNIDDIVNSAGGFAKDMVRGTPGAISKKARGTVQKALSDKVDVDAINREYSLWKGLENVAKATGQRQVGQQGAAAQLAKAAGLATGGAIGAATGGVLGGVPGALAGQSIAGKLTKIMSSAAWRTASATKKAAVAKALSSGKPELALNLATRLLGSGVGAASGERR